MILGRSCLKYLPCIHDKAGNEQDQEFFENYRSLPIVMRVIYTFMTPGGSLKAISKLN